MDTNPVKIIEDKSTSDAITLEIIDIIVTVANLEKLELMKKLCFEHPYTSFYAFCYGQTNGMLIQFRIPKTTGIYIETLFEELQDRGVILSFDYFNFPSPQLYTTTDHKGLYSL